MRNNLSHNVMNQLTATYGSADWSKLNAARFQFYDYVRYPVAGTTKLDFLNVAQGGTDPNSSTAKTIEQCNLPQSRGFGQQGFLINQIRLHASILPKTRQVSGISSDADVLYTTISDMMSKYAELLRRGVLVIKIGQKEYFDIQRPFENCPPGFGVNIRQHAGTYAAAGHNNFTTLVQQNSSVKNVYDLTPPQFIEPGQLIEAAIEFESTSPAFTGLVNSVDPRIDIGLILDGYVFRPGQ